MSQGHPRGEPRRRAAVSFLRRLFGARSGALLGLLLGLVLNAHGGSLDLDGRERGLNLQPHLQLLRDPSGALTAEQAMAPGQPFEPAAGRADLNLGYTRDAVWLRLELRSQARRAEHWQIEFGQPSLDRIELFSDDSPGPQLNGDGVPAGRRSSDHLSPVFRVHLAPGEQRTLYFRAQSTGNLSLAARIWQERAFARHSRYALMLQTAYLGMLAALAGYQLLLLAAVRKRSLLFHTLFIACCGGAMLAYSGVGAQYLWTTGGDAGNRALPVFLALAMAAAALFSREFLATRTAPRWHRMLGLAAGLYLGLALAALILPDGLALHLLALTDIAGILLLAACGLHGLARQVPGARLFTLAQLPLLLGALLLLLRSFALVPANLFTSHGIQLGAVLQMLLLSFAMAERLGEPRQPAPARPGAGTRTPQQTIEALQEQERLLEQRVAERTAALAEANARLSKLALQDPLTGVANRAGLNLRLSQAWQQAHHQQEMLALIMLDLDGFKAVNDAYGHAVGDLLLTQVAERLQASARSSDLVARLGGDEFVLICEAIENTEQAMALAERILQSLKQPMQLGDIRLSLSASIGISICTGQSYESLLREADQAMYLAKADGRSRIRLRHNGTSGLPQAGLA